MSFREHYSLTAITVHTHKRSKSRAISERHTTQVRRQRSISRIVMAVDLLGWSSALPGFGDFAEFSIEGLAVDAEELRGLIFVSTGLFEDAENIRLLDFLQ